GGGMAASLTGGLAGPLAAWCAAPIAAAMAFDRRKLVSGGAALALVAFALAFWAGLSGKTAVPPPGQALWLGALRVGLTVAWLMFGLVRGLRWRSDRAESASETARRLETLLAEQPDLILTIDTQGHVSSAFGAAPPGFSPDALFEQGLIAAVHHPDRPMVQTALYRAATHGAAEVSFSPRAALDRQSTLALRSDGGPRMIGVLRDSSVQHAREAALDAARAEAEALNAGKSRFLANM